MELTGVWAKLNFPLLTENGAMLLGIPRHKANSHSTANLMLPPAKFATMPYIVITNINQIMFEDPYCGNIL